MPGDEPMPDMIEITFDGKKLLVEPGRTLLEVAERQGVKIPTLCNDPRLEPFASCWVCLVKVERAKGFVPSCGTRVAPGMVVTTSSADVLAARRMAMELLLSNHYGDCKAPCTLACPSNVDIQGYLGLAANGKFAEAVELIRRDNPMPAVIGRVCPHPCETACRRSFVDEPLAINNVKRFVADLERAAGASFRPPARTAAKLGKRVAVVGAGPAGLAAAWYLGERGVDVTILEASEAAGGMLRWGIPDYRLPPAVLDASVRDMLAWGAELRCGVALGKDVTLAKLRGQYDAVVLAIGAWKSRALRIPGENHPSALSGIDFLRDVNAHRKVRVGERTAIIGGGNTALDAARCSLRCGAREVTIYYRRTREEMPASGAEIDEALEEGVRIEYLAAPVSIQVAGDHLSSLTLIRMALGEPDASGRRRPVPVDGSDHEVPVDTVISAVGQYPDTSALKEIPGLVDDKGNLLVDTGTGVTRIPGVFAAGDLSTGTDIAIRAIAGGKHAARAVLAHLAGTCLEAPKAFLSRKEDLRAPVAGDFAHVARSPRTKPRVADPGERRRVFDEIESTIPMAAASAEAARCLACGCQDVHECKLKEQAGDYGAIAKRFLGEVQVHPVDDSHPFISRDPAKCILCGRCIRICLEVQGIGVLGYLYRGFASVVAPSFGVPFGEDTTCTSCGQCVSACPVGALTEKLPAAKTVPLEERVEEGICSLCSLGCGIEYRWHGSLFTRVVARDGAPNHGKLCRKGKFGHDFLAQPVAVGALGRDGNAVSLAQARTAAEELLRTARAPVMRISPRLCGEGVDLFLDLAKRRGIPVEGDGLAGIDPRWAGFSGDGVRSPDGGAPGAPAPIRILVGDIGASNNVAFTEAWRERRQSGTDLWIVGAPVGDIASSRAASLFEPSLEALPALLERAGASGSRVIVVANPQQLREAHGEAGQKLVLDCLAGAAGVELLWNDRNAGYLLGKLAEDGGPRRPAGAKPDLLLDVCMDGTTVADGAARTIAWGLAPRKADLFVPVPREALLGGWAHTSASGAVRIGEIDGERLKELSLL